MIVHCYCGNVMEAEEVAICMNPKCEAYGQPVSARGEPTVDELVQALDFVEAVNAFYESPS